MNTKYLFFLRKVYYLTSRVVPFLPRETVCPVCEYLGIVDKSSVKVIKTSNDGIRYCECIKCGSHFRAYGENSDAKLEKVQNLCTDAEKSVTPKLKAGETDGNKFSPGRIKCGKRGNRSNSKRRTKLSD